jgi:lysozyme
MNIKAKIGAVAASLLAVTTSLVLFVEKEEGFGPENAQGLYVAYPDPGYGWKIPTICSGRTLGVKQGDTATREQCQTYLKEDLERSAQAVRRCVRVPITQDQFDALVSFQFNTGALCISELARKLNAGNCKGSAEEFNAIPRRDKAGNLILYKGQITYKWTTSNGIPFRGLISRRAKERAMFEKGCTP